MPQPSAADSTATWRVTFEGRPVEPTTAGPSVDDVIDDLLGAADEGLVRDRRGQTLAQEAVDELHWCLSGHISEALGDMRLSDVRPRHVKAMLRDLEESGLSRRRLRATAECVRTLFDYALERRLAEGNPAEDAAAALEPVPEPPPEAGDRPAVKTRLWQRRPAARAGVPSDRLVAFGLQLSTAVFALIAVVLLAQTL